jgi:hypothetical protein
MQTHTFIKLNVTSKDDITTTRYVNIDHIQQIYETNGIIYVELSGYDTLTIHGENIAIFMDRFVK